MKFDINDVNFLNDQSLIFILLSVLISMQKTIEKYRSDVKKDEICTPENEVHVQVKIYIHCNIIYIVSL